jgi:ADP-heptose:LPS heptosyltransferase
MNPLLDRLPPGSRIDLIRLRSLGDCVLTTPAIALLKAHRPDLKINVIVEPRFAAVFEGNPDVDSTSSDVSRPPASADLVLNFHGGTRSMLMTALSRAKLRAGFGHHRYNLVYTHKIPRAQEILGAEETFQSAEHLASAMFWMGVPRTEIPRAKLIALEPPPDFGRPYAVIHAFASAPDKTWATDRFSFVAERLRESHNLEPVFLAGPGDDPSLFSGFEVWRDAPLGRVKSLMAGAALFIGNDSGPAHIAAAFGVPVVVLFGASDSIVWAPWRTESRVLKALHGIQGISVEDVMAAAQSLQTGAEKIRA